MLEGIREVRSLESKLLRLLPREVDGLAISGHRPRDEPRLTVDRVEGRGVIRQRVTVDRATVAAGQREHDGQQPNAARPLAPRHVTPHHASSIPPEGRRQSPGSHPRLGTALATLFDRIELTENLAAARAKVHAVTLVALKLLLAPSFIVATSVLARHVGVRLAGVVGGLPVVAGPILLVIAIEHGRSFAADAATGTLLGVVALIVFVLVYVAVSRRLGWPSALLAGWTSFFAAIVFACGACAATLVVLPRPPARLSSVGAYPRWDLPLRAVCAVIPIVVVTAAARALGPHLTGLLASFPIITPVLAAFTQAQQGKDEVVRLLRGMTVGFYAYALFCFVVSVTVRGLGIAASFALATTLALVVQGVAIALSRRRERPASAAGALAS